MIVHNELEISEVAFSISTKIFWMLTFIRMHAYTKYILLNVWEAERPTKPTCFSSNLIKKSSHSKQIRYFTTNEPKWTFVAKSWKCVCVCVCVSWMLVPEKNHQYLKVYVLFVVACFTVSEIFSENADENGENNFFFSTQVFRLN